MSAHDGRWERLKSWRTQVGMRWWSVLAVVVAVGLTAGLYGVFFLCWQPYVVAHGAAHHPVKWEPGSPASQLLADGIGAALGVEPASVRVRREAGFLAWSDCEPAPAGSTANTGACFITLSEAADHASADMPDLVRTLMGHEYGHIALWRANRHPGYVLYLSPYLAMLIVELSAGLLWLRKDVVWLFPVLGLALGTLWYYVHAEYDTSSIAALAWGIGGGMVVAFLIDEGTARRRGMASLGLGGALVAIFVIGINLRNAPFRAEEIGNDRLAVKIAGIALVGKLFCVLQAQEQAQQRTAHKEPIDVFLIHWTDIHPAFNERAQAQGFSLACPANQAVPGMATSAIDFQPQS